MDIYDIAERLWQEQRGLEARVREYIQKRKKNMKNGSVPGIGGALIIAKENLVHLTTITEIFARLLSYSRIFAIGISHYTLLHIIPFPWGHLLTLTLEFMMAFIHDLRLHVVEFASIGLEGGARWFEVKP